MEKLLSTVTIFPLCKMTSAGCCAGNEMTKTNMQQAIKVTAQRITHEFGRIGLGLRQRSSKSFIGTTEWQQYTANAIKTKALFRCQGRSESTQIRRANLTLAMG